jgi:hypothetical protein
MGEEKDVEVGDHALFEVLSQHYLKILSKTMKNFSQDR